MRFPSCTQRQAFSSLQLVVVLAILLIFMGLLIPIIARLREMALVTQSTNNLRQMALAMHNYHDVYKSFPPAVGTQAGQTGSAHFHILPFVEQDNLFRKANGSVWKNGTDGAVVEVFLDPRDPSLPNHVFKNWLATTNYPVNWMVFQEGKRSIAMIVDGTSNTLMVAQRYQMCNGHPTAWGYSSIYTWAPMFGYYSEGKFQSAPTQGNCDARLAQAIARDILVALCDGSVRSLAHDTRPSTWYFLMDPADGNVIAADDF